MLRVLPDLILSALCAFGCVLGFLGFTQYGSYISIVLGVLNGVFAFVHFSEVIRKIRKGR